LNSLKVPKPTSGSLTSETDMVADVDKADRKEETEKRAEERG
jgi:hypothetical protein